MPSSVPLALLCIGRLFVSCFHLLFPFVLKSAAKVVLLFVSCKHF